MPRWLGGESISINDVCTQEYAEMVTKSEEVYANSPMPFAPATSLAELWEDTPPSSQVQRLKCMEILKKVSYWM